MDLDPTDRAPQRRGDRVAQAEGGCADQDPRAGEHIGLAQAPLQDVRCRHGVQRAAGLVVRNTHISIGVQRHPDAWHAAERERPIRVPRPGPRLHFQWNGLLPIEREQPGQRKRRIVALPIANESRNPPHRAVRVQPGRDMARGRTQPRYVADEALGRDRRRQAGFAGQGAGKFTALLPALVLECEHLGQHGRPGRARGGQCFRQFARALARIRKDDVIQLERGPLLAQRIDQARLRLSGPRPRTDALQAGVIDVDDHDPPLFAGSGAQLPHEIGGTLVRLVQCNGCDKRKTCPGQQRRESSDPSQPRGPRQEGCRLNHGRDQRVIPDKVPAPTAFSKK